MRRVLGSTLAPTVLAGLAAASAACVTLTPERAAEQDAMWAAARECKAKFGTIQSIERIDAEGRLHFTYHGSGPDNAAFLQCYREGLTKRLGSTSGLSAGRVSATTRALGRTTVPLTTSGNAIFVAVRANDAHAATLLLDTGATSTVLTPKLASRLGIAPGPGARSRVFHVAGGRSFSVPFAKLPSLKVGDFAVEDLDVGVYNIIPHVPELDGVLGADFLQHFRTSLDLGARTLTLEVKPAAADPPTSVTR